MERDLIPKKNYRMVLNEMRQAGHSIAAFYEPHGPPFTANVRIDGDAARGTGIGPTKSEAMEIAAEAAVRQFMGRRASATAPTAAPTRPTFLREVKRELVRAKDEKPRTTPLEDSLMTFIRDTMGTKADKKQVVDALTAVLRRIQEGL